MSAESRRDDLDREIRAHLDLEAEERVTDGADPERARYEARRAFGNVALVREAARAVWIPAWLDQTAQDARYAARRLRRSPALALTTVLILTAGIGLNLGFFQILNIAALRPLPVADVESLVRFDRITPRFSSNGIPYPATQFIREHNGVLASVLTSTADEVVWGDDPNDRIEALYVSANWFRELGHSAASGRLFDESDERPGTPPLAVVSHEFWTTRLNGEAAAGRSVRVNDRPVTLIGVAPRGFTGLRLSDTAIWLLIHQRDDVNAGSRFTEDWAAHSTQLYARLKPGVTLAAAREGLRATAQELAQLQPGHFGPGETFQPYSGATGFRTPRDNAKLRTIAMLIGGLMVLVLIVACANLSNLILSQAIARHREFSVRAALGASRWRILRQQLVETSVLTAAGTVFGLVAGQWGARLVGSQIALPEHLEFTLDWRLALAACAIAFVATAAIGFVPAWMLSRRQLVSDMKDGGQQTSSGLSRARFRQWSIAAQVIGCCVLLIVAGMTVRGLERLLDEDRGFAFEHLAVLDPALSRHGISGELARAFWTDVKESVGRHPEVESVALASHGPMGTSAARSRFNDAPRLSVTQNAVEPAFFALLRIPFVAGRNFGPGDDPATTVIISRRLAEEMYGTVDAVGKSFPGGSGERTIVGIVADAPLINVAATNVGEMYLPVDPARSAGLILIAGAKADPQRLLVPMREAARSADRRVLPRTWLLSQSFALTLQARQVASLMAAAVGLLALSLACFGVYGLVSYASTLRTREIGIRRALGASGGSIVRLLLKQLAIPLAAGMMAGTAAGVAVATLLEGEPFYLPAPDLLTPIAALAVFVGAAAAAAVLPALRSLAQDPLVALRHE
jgi:predicted permease